MAAGPTRAAGIATATTAAVLLSGPTPAASVRTLCGTPSSSDPLAPLLALVALVAWALLGWLLVVAAAALTARAPGLAGRIAGAVVDRIAPATVRRVVEVCLGLTMAAGALGPSPASASPAGPPAPPPPAASLDWPMAAAALDGDPAAATPSATASPAFDWDPAAAAPAPMRLHPALGPRAAAPTSRSATRAPVIVRRGDSLWAVAADHLPSNATQTQVAQAWPAWWAANRDAIGADPDLIHPGLRLDPPAHL